MGLAQKEKSSEGSMSDCEFIKKDFSMHQWACLELDLEASEYGSVSNRLRKVFVGMKGAGRDVYMRLNKVAQWMLTMKIGPGSVKDIIVDDNIMRKFLQVLPDETVPKKLKSTQDSWQYQHMQFFEAAKQPWPPASIKPAEFDSSCSQLSDREMEILVLAHVVFGVDKQPRDQLFCIDVNDEIRRHFGFLTDQVAKDSSDACNVLKDPWKKPLVMTLVGSSHIVVRVFQGLCF